ncbi:MAG: hypothetical protein ACI93R_000601 [Flavobacteriales bacterium]|jgi:hypothetical protein
MKHAVNDYPENVIDLFSGQPLSALIESRIVRLAPELDGLEMLYTNDSSGDKFYSLKILCWALRDDGEVVGLVPWLNDLVPCPKVDDPLCGQFEGYYDPGIDELFESAPKHKIVELEAAAQYYDIDSKDPEQIIQEIPDVIGTHAVITCLKTKTLILQELVSWRLLNDGSIIGMIVNEESVENTPILPGDNCLYSAQSDSDFKYFFQNHIANKIKSEDPEALAAISVLVDDKK